MSKKKKKVRKEETTEVEKVIGVTITHSLGTGLKIQTQEGTNINDLDKLIRAAEVELTNTRLSALEGAVRQQAQALRETITILESVANPQSLEEEESMVEVVATENAAPIAAATT